MCDEAGRMCAGGFYLYAKGVPIQALFKRVFPDWLRPGLDPDWSFVDRLSFYNDTLYGPEREARIRELFAEHGIEVSFED